MKKLVSFIGIAAAMLLISSSLFGQKKELDPIVAKMIELAKEDNQTMNHLDVLCNTIGGRLTGSDNYNHAADWAVYMFRKWGLEAEKIHVGDIPVGFNRGPWFGKMINGEESLHFTTPSYTAGTKGVQRGHVVMEPKSTQEFERMKHTIKGAWVLIGGKSTGWPIDYSERGDAKRAEIIAKNDSIIAENMKLRGTGKKPAPLIEEPALFYKEMIQAGALGIIQSAPVPITTLYDRKNIMEMTWETLPTLPDIKLDERQYEAIKKRVELREYVVLEFDIRNNFFMGPVPFYSVIAYIRGTEKPEELVISSCHLDCYDVATGGVDCGTGVAPAMEAARLLAAAGAKPKRTIMFALWAAEEYGLLGSTHWVENNPDKLDKIVNLFNRDGGPTVANSWTVPNAWYKELADICAPLKDLNPEMPFTLTSSERYPIDIPKNAGGSDHAPFVKKGVPALSFGTGDPLGYNFSYREIWHTDRDLYNMSIPPYMEHTAVVNAIVFWGVANMDKRLPSKAVYKK